MRLVKISGPAEDVMAVTVDQVLEHLRNDDVTEAQSDLLKRAIRAAERKAETALNRKVLSQVWEVWLDHWPSVIRLDSLGNLQSVESVVWLAPDGSPQTYSLNDVVEIKTLPAEVYLTGGSKALLNRPDALRVRVRVGYGDGGDSVPECVQQWILYQVCGMDAQRNPLVVGSINSALDDRFVDGLLDPERIPCL